MNKKVRTRFAPSPTGFMHLGGLRTALYAYLYAKHFNGDFVLRIEDTDKERFVEGSLEVIYSSLLNSGLVYDEGPDVGGDFGPYIQTQRKDIYLKYAEKLVELGGAYYCFCTKERLETLTDDKGNRKYDKHCLSLSKKEVKERIERGEPYVIRQNIPTEGTSHYDDLIFGSIDVDYAELEDNVLIKSDGLPTYNFANVVDDHLMQISHVIRGTEYLSSTPKYNLMYDAFGWERPVYIHLPTIMKDATRKLSKRYGDANFDDFVNKGYLEEAIINYVALLGWCPKNNAEKMTLPEMIDLFDLSGISKSPSIFDDVKLRWLNGEYLKAMTDEEFLKRAEPFFKKTALYGKFDLLKISKLIRTRIEIFNDIEEKTAFLISLKDFDLNLFENAKQKSSVETAKTLLPLIIKGVESIETFDNSTIFNALSIVANENGVKSKTLFYIMRIALTGLEVTPGGATEISEILGKEESLNRLNQVLNRL